MKHILLPLLSLLLLSTTSCKTTRSIRYGYVMCHSTTSHPSYKAVHYHCYGNSWAKVNEEFPTRLFMGAWNLYQAKRIRMFSRLYAKCMTVQDGIDCYVIKR